MSRRSASFGEGYDPTVVDRLGVWLSARQIRRFVPSFAQKRVADFGCGYHASFARTLAGEAASVLVADVSLSPELSLDSRVRAAVGPLPDTLAALPAASLDVVLCISVLEHLWEPLDALTHFHRLLAPGGVCLVNVPSWAGKRYLELSAFRLGLSPAAEMNDHKAYYDVKDLWPLLVRAGFLPQNIDCFSHKLGLNTFAVCVKR